MASKKIMKKIVLTLLLGISTVLAYGQGMWHPTAATFSQSGKTARGYYTLDVAAMKTALSQAGRNLRTQYATVELPTLSGQTEKFQVISMPVAEASLAAKYDLGSYAGTGVDDPQKYVRFSFSNGKLQAMIIKGEEYQFIDPVDPAQNLFGVFEKSSKNTGGKAFVCSTTENILSRDEIDKLYEQNRLYSDSFAGRVISGDKKYRTLRLALSVTGEYTRYFGGTLQGALTAMNATITRVNAVLERDLAIHLNMIDKPELIYTDPDTDPYSAASSGVAGAWNMELQKTLTNIVGEGNYDIGHLFGATGGGGNAGCLGCICVSPTVDANGIPNGKGKGSGFTSPADGKPFGDNFDIDYVAHEIGHQLGANHTFSHKLEGTGANQEPGSGSTIMGYAGITGALNDVQPHTDPYYHYFSIEQIQKVMQKATCDVETDLANNPPVINPLIDYTIPKGTAFVLTASAYDPDGDAITYTWEQADNAAVAINKNNIGTTATGPSFRSKTGTAIPTRYFPALPTVMNGVLRSPDTWESVSMVARKSNFAVTARDNFYSGGQTQTSTMAVNIGDDGPFAFTILSNKFYTDAPQTITWDVVNTDKAPYNVVAVSIDCTADNGTTWTTITPSTPNDGLEKVSIPASMIGKQVKFRVTALRNVFYAVSKAYDVFAAPAACDGKAPANITVVSVAPKGAVIQWDAVQKATYVVRYRQVGTTAWTEIKTDVPYIVLSGLWEERTYEIQVAAVCSNGTAGEFSAPVTFTTKSSVTYCTVAPPSAAEEYISNVTINSQSFDSKGGPGYVDNYQDPSKVIKLVAGSTNNKISVSKVWTDVVYNESVAAWIDFNRNGVFEASEKILSTPPSQETPVTGTFIVPSDVDINNTVRMRVIMRYKIQIGDDEACKTFKYGEIEDYKVAFEEGATLSTSTARGAAAARVYPNPAESVLYVSGLNAKAEYTIFDLSGKKVKQGTLTEGAAEVSALVKGVYILQVNDRDATQNFKFIKK